jgi:hypothetical protein
LSIGSPLRKDSGLSSKALVDLILQFMIGLKRRLIGYCKWGLFNHAGMWGGFLIVPIEKKDSKKIRVCIDFRDLNRATPKDEYPMPIADMLINDASEHRVISFLDGNASYN